MRTVLFFLLSITVAGSFVRNGRRIQAQQVDVDQLDQEIRGIRKLIIEGSTVGIAFEDGNNEVAYASDPENEKIYYQLQFLLAPTVVTNDPNASTVVVVNKTLSARTNSDSCDSHRFTFSVKRR